MEAFQIILKQMMENDRPILQQAFDGDLTEFCYLKNRDEWGVGDANYRRRMALSYLLWFFHDELPEPALEQLVRTLFQEELHDRETNDFQGIGSGLENLTRLLAFYGKSEDQELFARAKNANFDCACGYEVVALEPGGEFVDSIDAAIEIAFDMGHPDTAQQLLSIWKKEHEPMQLQDYQRLLYWLKQLSDREEIKRCQNEILRLTLVENQPWKSCSAYQSSIKLLIEEREFEQAEELFFKLMPLLPLAAQDWYRFGLGKFVLENCMDLVLHGGNRQQKLWRWAKPYLDANAQSFHGNLYDKAIQAAKLMKSDSLADKLQGYYDSMLQSIAQLKR